MSALLEIKDLVVQRGSQTVLRVPALDVRQGEMLSVIGPNGAGKSTLLLVMAALIEPLSGGVRFLGKSIAEIGALAYRRRIGLVLQDPLLMDDTVANNVAMGLRFRGMPGGAIKERVHVWLERLGIAHLAQRRARALSGGEAQRASLARAFALQADLLLLDEPFTALDTPTRLALLQDFQSLMSETHQTAVFITHNMEEALMLGQRVAVLLDGGLRQVGQPDEVFSAPADADVAAFVGVETILPGRVTAAQDGLLHIEAGQFRIEAVGEVPADQAVYVCLRPEDVTLWLDGGAPSSSARNRIHGRITRLTPQGALVRVVVDCGGFPLTALVTRASAREMHLQPELAVCATFKASAIHLISHKG